MCFIYGLWEPGSAGEIRYVGKTTTGVRRFYHYSNDRTHTLRGRWLQGLRNRGKRFAFVVLEYCSRENLSDRERFWIRWCREQGFRLTNLTDGGDGTLGHVPSPEQRAKARASNLGKKRSAETVAKFSIAQKRIWSDPTHRERMSKAHIGKQSHLGIPHGEETRKRISESRKATAAARPEIVWWRGEKSRMAKLTEADVRAIRAACAAGEKQCVVARRFGIKDPQVSYIVNRKSWKHVP